jgi:4-amino-4-deoxy-L-arabinose transferase-like glycosyltransferase
VEKRSFPSAGFPVLCLILLTVGFRVIDLQADPPANFSWSGGYFADEGFWSHNARNEVLFGNPVRDEWDARIVSPIFAFLQKCVFRLLGVGLVQVRFIGIVSALGIAILAFLLLRKEFDPGVSFFCAVLVSLNYPMLILGRQGILDPFAAALATLALLLLTMTSRTAAFLGGAVLVGACITKYLMIYAFLPCAVALMPVRKNSLFPFFAGIVSAATLWLVTNYLPHRELLQAYSGFYASQQSWHPLQVAKNIVLQPFYLYFAKTPAILFLGNLMLWFLPGRFREANKTEKILWTWLAGGILFFALWRYRPLRYYTSLCVPLAALAGIGILRRREIFEHGPRIWLVIGLLLPAVQFGFLLCDHLFGWNVFPEQLGIEIVDLILFLALSTIGFILIYIRKSRWLVPAFVIAFLLGDLRSYLSWVLRPEYAAVQISRDLQQRVGNGVVTGQWAPELCLENELRVAPVWYGFVNSTDPFRRFGITHVLVWRYALGGEKFEEWYPEEFRRFRPVARYRIKQSDLVLYEKENKHE